MQVNDGGPLVWLRNRQCWRYMYLDIISERIEETIKIGCYKVNSRFSVSGYLEKRAMENRFYRDRRT